MHMRCPLVAPIYGAAGCGAAAPRQAPEGPETAPVAAAQARASRVALLARGIPSFAPRKTSAPPLGGAATGADPMGGRRDEVAVGAYLGVRPRRRTLIWLRLHRILHRGKDLRFYGYKS